MAAIPPELADGELLSAYARRRDAGAFAELVRRYGGLVYGTALRVTRNDADAQDVSQECFLRLARQAGAVKQPVPAWLHTIARSRAIDLTRRALARHRNERRATALDPQPSLSEWDAVQPNVDEAIAQLPDELRDLITRHYLCGVSQSDLAAATGLSQPTVSRRLAEAVGQLRESLARSGATLSVPAMAAGLEQCHQVSIPPALTASLGKLAISGLPAAGVNAKLVAAIVAAVLAAAGLLLFTQLSTRNTAMQTTSPAGQAVTPNTTDRLVLDGVPRVGFDTSTCPLPACGQSVLSYLGDKPDLDTLMATSGAAFRLVFNRDDGGNVDIMRLGLEPARRMFLAAGRDYRYIPPDSRDQMIAAVRQSIAVGRPVIGFGVLGGPPEACIIAGYDRGGQTLIGWSHFDFGDANRPATVMKEQPDWSPVPEYGQSHGLVVLGDRSQLPLNERQVLIATLEYAIDLARTPRRTTCPDHAAGLSAYAAWASALEVDGDYPAADAKVIEARGGVQGDMARMVVERLHAAAYLRQAATGTPEAADDLNAAASLYASIGNSSGVWPWGGFRHGGGQAIQRDIADPAIRRSIAAAVRQAGVDEALAVGHLEAALATLKGLPSRAEFPLPTPDPNRYQGQWFPKDAPAPAVLRGLVDVLNEDLGLTWVEPRFGAAVNPVYVAFTAMTGDAFTHHWFTTVPRDPKVASELYLPDPSAMYRRALAAAGIRCEVLASPRPPEADAQFGPLDVPGLKERVIACLTDRKMPVIVGGIPKHGDLMLVTGYEDGGNTLIGWWAEGGHDGVTFNPADQQKVADWVGKVHMVVIPTGRLPRLSEREAVLQTLTEAERQIRQDQIGLVRTGRAFFDAWADAMEAGDVPANSMFDRPSASLEQRRRWLVDPTAWDVDERSMYAAMYLRRAAEVYPEAAEELNAARASMEAVSAAANQTYHMMGMAPGDPPPAPGTGMDDPEMRKQAAALIRGCKAKWIEAADHLEAALAKTH